MTATRKLLGMGVLAILLGAGWLLWRELSRVYPIDDGRVRIISSTGPTVAEHRDRSAIAPANRIVDAPATPLPDLTSLSVNERSAALDSRTRDPAWAGPMEAELTRQLAGAMGGIVVQSARCADGLCAVEVQLRHVADRQAAIDRLVAGHLIPAYARAGLIPAASIEIEADEAGDLHLTQYLQRSR